jgi:ribose-phosphate pyrophosphokinase
MIRVEADGRPVEHRTIIFSGGEVQPRLLDPPAEADQVRITAHVWSSDELMETLLVYNACRNQWLYAQIHLVLPYLPYARQDRVCHPGEANSLRLIGALIAACNFSSIEIWDPHNPTATRDTIRKSAHLRFRYAVSFVERIPTLTTDRTVIVAPDAGGHQRALQCASTLMCPLIQATKTRDPDTGELGPPIVTAEHIGSRDFLIVDDICDGGRTFVNLAKVLRPLTDGKIYLYVTHGIFSVGFGNLFAAVDHIYVANLKPLQRFAQPSSNFLTVLT